MNTNRILAAAVLAAALLPASRTPSHAAVPDPAADYPLERGADPGEQWKEKLGLSAEQARRFSLLENEKAARLKPLRELLRLEMVRLQTYLAENGTEREVEDCLAQVQQINRAIAERTERLDAGLASFLSPTQRARLLVWRALGGLNGYAARRLDAPDDLARRAAGGDHVLDDQASLARGEGEAPAQAHHAVLALAEQRARAEGARDLVRDEDAADRGREHRAGASGGQARGQGAPERLRVLRVLEDERRLQIDVRVEPRREPEVAAQQRARLLVEVERLPLGHAAPSSRTMAAAAAAGSAAPVIGRPTTR